MSGFSKGFLKAMEAEAKIYQIERQKLVLRGNERTPYPSPFTNVHEEPREEQVPKRNACKGTARLEAKTRETLEVQKAPAKGSHDRACGIVSEDARKYPSMPPPVQKKSKGGSPSVTAFSWASNLQGSPKSKFPKTEEEQEQEDQQLKQWMKETMLRKKKQQQADLPPTYSVLDEFLQAEKYEVLEASDEVQVRRARPAARSLTEDHDQPEAKGREAKDSEDEGGEGAQSTTDKSRPKLSKAAMRRLRKKRQKSGPKEEVLA